MKHELKIMPQYLKLIINGSKNWEIRKNDRRFKEGDEILVREIEPTGEYTGREAGGIITYVFSNEEMLKPGYVILSVNWKYKNIGGKHEY